MANFKKILLSFALIFLFVLISVLTWVYSQVNSALPILEGKKTLYGLNAQVIVDRDILGIPTIKAKNRLDAAIALGFIHGQERFFQMDLLRRNSAGELSSLFGKLALDYDKSIRKHRFRDRARKIIQNLPPKEFAIVKAYTQGVNQGLHTLNSSPFEYLLLQQDPVDWQEEDTVLTVLSMYIDLQYHDGKRERALGLMSSVLGKDVFAFLNPKGSIWDAAIDDTTYSPAPMPSRPWPSASSQNDEQVSQIAIDYDGEQFPGSNNWAVSGNISQTSSAIVANDMHLGIRVPNTWFRASIEYTNVDEKVKVTGVTLPGTPNIIAGSNSHIAWGFTNSYGDWSDVVVLETNEDKSQYLTPDGYKPFVFNKQVIAIKGQESIEIDIQETQWGPIIGENHKGELLAYRWVAHDLQAVNLKQLDLELAKTVDDAFAIATQTGIPAQNLMVGDNQGNIGWTIMGAIPTKKGNIGDIPTSWASGENGWTGYLSPGDYPKVKNPEHNRLWTANSRVVGNEMIKQIGNGGYALGARSTQIRDGLFKLDSFSEQDLLDIALDDNAEFLKRWQSFLLENVLTEQAISDKPLWKEAKSYVIQTPFKASVDSVGYRIVRNFRLAVRTNVFEELKSNLQKLDKEVSFRGIRSQLETPLWEMVTNKPENFLWLSGKTWDELLSQSLDQTLADMTKEQSLAQATWGQQNTTAIQHPLSKAVPLIGRWLDMPKTPLPGDSNTPRVQGKAFGASERMIVSPGHEERGIFHMPTSQAGHPWSPYYGMGHEDWEQGKPSPFLPGKTEYSLTLISY